MSDLEGWLKSGEYLPSALRDFHDQKAVFKTIDDTVALPPDSLMKRPTWIEAHCYVIDVFLWYMARRGYTLQRSRARLSFRSLDDDVKANEARRSAAFAKAIGLTPLSPQTEGTKP